MLRLKAATSPVAEFSQGSFLPVIADPAPLDPAAVRKVILCSGKIYYDLAGQRATKEHQDAALIRVERLYPLPEAELRGQLAHYPAEAEVVWAQEEPGNMGAWPTLALHLPTVLGRQVHLVSLPPSSAPAAGSSVKHAAEHADVIAAALS
jgi:2-oxoglutarate dehydrogenase E1 component